MRVGNRGDGAKDRLEGLVRAVVDERRQAERGLGMERSKRGLVVTGDAGARRVALVEPAPLVEPEAPRPEGDGKRRAVRRLKLLAGLLSRGKGGAIDG